MESALLALRSLQKYIPISVILFLFCLSLLAKSDEWVVYNTGNSALPDNQVQAITVDSNDVLWIGTANGLARFDGSQWTTYTTSNTAIPSSFITALATGDNSTVWIGTNKGLARYDGTRWTSYDSTTVQGNLTISRIFFDPKAGVLWAGTEKGLIRFDGTTWTRYDDSNSGLAEDLVRSVAVDKDGTLWVGTFDHFKFLGRLWKFDGTNWSTTRLDLKELPSSFPDVLTVDRNNVLWLGVKGTIGGAIVRIEGDRWKVFRATDSPWLHGGVSSLVFEDTTAWIGSGSGLVMYDGENWMGFTTATSGLPENYVSSVALDGKGNKWVGTIGGGVAVYKNGGVVTSAEEQIDDSEQCWRLWNYPNPVSFVTTVAWQVPASGSVMVSMYNSTGEQITTLYNGYTTSGQHTLSWRPANLPDGLYFCRMTWPGGSITSKVLVQR